MTRWERQDSKGHRDALKNSMTTIAVYSDYVCPYCFFAEHLLSRVADRQPLTIEWMPFELRPSPHPTLRLEGEYLTRVWRESIYPMAERLDIPIILPRISPQPHTGLAFEGYQYALEVERGPTYTHKMFTAFFQEERNIGELPVLIDLARELKLDVEEFKKALETGRYRERHQEALRHAREDMRITAVPTFVRDDRQLQGLHSLSQLQRFLSTDDR